MTDSDLRELDGWIAEHIFQQTKPPYAHNPPHTDPIGDGVWVCQPKFAGGDNCNWKPLPFSSDPAAFALVKREIERRGWDWEVSKRSIGFTFNVLINDTEKILRVTTNKFGKAASEELAGCLAVRAAVEASSSIPPT